MAEDGPITVAGTGCTKHRYNLGTVVVLREIEGGSVVAGNEKGTSWADTSTSWSISNLTDFARPIEAAIVIGGGLPKFTSAPASTRAATTSSLPVIRAHCSGVLKEPLFGSAPSCTSTRTKSGWSDFAQFKRASLKMKKKQFLPRHTEANF